MYIKNSMDLATLSCDRQIFKPYLKVQIDSRLTNKIAAGEQ